MINKIPLSINKRFKIWRLRNFYLAFVLAKSEFFKKESVKIFTDEFSFQALFMILHKRTNKQEVLNILKKLPQSEVIFLFEGRRDLRYKAYKKKHPLYPNATLLPGSRIDKSFANEWMKIMEYNFRIIKYINKCNDACYKNIHTILTLYKRIHSFKHVRLILKYFFKGPLWVENKK